MTTTNPPVYIYSLFQSEATPKKEANTFTEFIDDLIFNNLKNVITINPVYVKNFLRIQGEGIFFNKENKPYINKVKISKEVYNLIHKKFQEEEAKVVKEII